MNSDSAENIIKKSIIQNESVLKELLIIAQETLQECKEDWELKQYLSDEPFDKDLEVEYWIDTEKELGKKIRRFFLNHAQDGLTTNLKIGFCFPILFFLQELMLIFLEKINFRDISDEILEIYKKQKISL